MKTSVALLLALITAAGCASTQATADRASWPHMCPTRAAGSYPALG